MVTPRSMETWPSSGCSSRVMSRKSVDLPAPLGPTRPTFSPRCSVAEASRKRIWFPCCLPMASRRIKARSCNTAAAGAPRGAGPRDHPSDVRAGARARLLLGLGLRRVHGEGLLLHTLDLPVGAPLLDDLLG